MRQKAFGRGRQPCGRQQRVAVPSEDADARAWRWLGLRRAARVAVGGVSILMSAAIMSLAIPIEPTRIWRVVARARARRVARKRVRNFTRAVSSMC